MFITTCPSCKSKFRITEQHLSAADGLVVCSSCHNIFQANESLQQMPTATQKATPKPQVQKSAPSAAQTMQKPAENTPPPQPEPQPQPEPAPQPEPEQGGGGGGAADWLALFGLLGLAASKRRLRKA